MLIKTTRDLGALVRDRRLALGLTLDGLAERVPMSRRWIVDVEAGSNGAAFGSILSLLDVLGVELRSSPKDTSSDAVLDAHLENLRREHQWE
jgi:HTH-type transcriptional regulator/antitoxin HipB